MKTKPNVIYEVEDIMPIPVTETRNKERAQTRLPFSVGGGIVPTYVTVADNGLLGVIIDDPHQRHWELLAFAGAMPDPDHGLMDWITIVLQGLSIKYPESSSQERLDKLMDFVDFCRKTRG